MNKLLQNNMQIKMFLQHYLFKIWKIIFNFENTFVFSEVPLLLILISLFIMYVYELTVIKIRYNNLDDDGNNCQPNMLTVVPPSC